MIKHGGDMYTVERLKQEDYCPYKTDDLEHAIAVAEQRSYNDFFYGIYNNFGELTHVVYQQEVFEKLISLR